MDITLAYNKEKLALKIPDQNLLSVLTPNESGNIEDAVSAVKASLDAPIDSAKLCDIVNPGESVAIITSDITRPMPSHVVLPPLLEELNAAGIADQDITVVFALGSHRAHTGEEMRKLVGDRVFERVKCIDSIGDFMRVGVSSRSTPYDVFTPVVRADRRICLSNIEYHYFAGYSGGAKAIMPGVCTRDAIQANHSRMVEADAKAGLLEGNPVREDIDEVQKFIPIDFIVNVVLDEQKKIRHVVSGHWKTAHRAGCVLLDKMYKVNIEQKADIVVVSPGGYPKDINLYQAQKALDNAKHAVKDGGTIILVASCREGLGEHVFEIWMKGHEKASDMIPHIMEDFQLGGHKAAAIALVLEKANVVLVSDLPADFVRSIHLQPADTVQKAFDEAAQHYGDSASVLVMPYGGATLPNFTHNL